MRRTLDQVLLRGDPDDHIGRRALARIYRPPALGSAFPIKGSPGVPLGPHAGLARSINVTEATVSSTIVRAAIAIGQPFGQSVGREEVRLKTFINTLFVCSVLLGGCTHKEPTSPPPADQEKKSDPRATATAKQTLDELSSTPATALDLGLQRLRSEFVPQFDKQLRTQGIFPSLDASYSANPQFGFVLVRLDRSDDDVGDRVITISVTTPVTGDYASDKRVAELQALESRSCPQFGRVSEGVALRTKSQTLRTTLFVGQQTTFITGSSQQASMALANREIFSTGRRTIFTRLFV